MGKLQKRGLPYPAIAGMDLAALMQLLWRNRFRVDLCYLDRIGFLIALGILNSILKRCEAADNGHKIEKTQIEKPPIFIIGHWRSGTTHLHNLLNLNDHFTCPSVYQAFFPLHFCYSQPRGLKIFNFLAPNTRPMDNMAFSASAPYEEEFATAALSTVSPYMRFLFPVTGDNGHSELDARQLSKKEIERWKGALIYFLKALTFSKGKQIVLKSPPNMGRIGTLLDIFPGAKFIHIVRNPYDVYLSTVRLWKDTLSRVHLEKPDWEVVEELILSWYTKLFSLYERDRGLIPAGSFHELKFEELENEPYESLEKLYNSIGLPNFSGYRNKLALYSKKVKGYKKNQYHLDTISRKKVRERWQTNFERFNYPV